MRRPRYLTDQQRAEVEDHPELEDARCNLSKIRAQYKETQEPGMLLQLQHREKEVRNTRKRLHRSLRHYIREKFDEEKAFFGYRGVTIGRCGQGNKKRWIILGGYYASTSVRDAGTDAVVQYCDVLEGGPLRGRPRKKAPDSAPLAESIAQPHAVQQTRSGDDIGERPDREPPRPERATREYLAEATRPAAYFQCFASEGTPDSVRLRMFHDAGSVTRHFDAIHLDEMPLKCNWCEVTLLHQMGFQRHANEVHRVLSRRQYPFPMQELQKH
ncbi:hypothetical protein N7488_003887 [Penicillium malachiteum]|nr:hypothetical protein N7488_003887 [Penicillium malachiteum]